MNWLPTFILLAAAFLAVFLQSAINTPRWLMGVQVDALPGLMVYAALTHGPGGMAWLAVLGGLWFDSLSANPPGVSVLPLWLAGWVVHQNRGVILRHEIFAQAVLGLTASAAVPAGSVLLLFTFGCNPLIGWASLWQWALVAAAGGLLSPLLFRWLDALNHAVVYPNAPGSSLRSDREIVRGRA